MNHCIHQNTTNPPFPDDSFLPTSKKDLIDLHKAQQPLPPWGPLVLKRQQKFDDQFFEVSVAIELHRIETLFQMLKQKHRGESFRAFNRIVFNSCHWPGIKFLKLMHHLSAKLNPIQNINCETCATLLLSFFNRRTENFHFTAQLYISDRVNTH